MGASEGIGESAANNCPAVNADVLSRAVRQADTAGRIGGEEFALALPGCRGDAHLVIARRIRTAFQKDARFVNGQPVNATVSVGVATAPEHGFSLVEIIASADSALYRAKDMGRNRAMLAAQFS
jgi:diguanylate cyclase (GGDEF)-like protein